MGQIGCARISEKIGGTRPRYVADGPRPVARGRSLHRDAPVECAGAKATGWSVRSIVSRSEIVWTGVWSIRPCCQSDDPCLHITLGVVPMPIISLFYGLVVSMYFLDNRQH